MNHFVTLLSRRCPPMTPMVRVGEKIVVFVFCDADAAMGYAITHLNGNEGDWATRQHDYASIVQWLRTSEKVDAATHVAFNPVASELKGLVPIELFSGIIEWVQKLD